MTKKKKTKKFNDARSKTTASSPSSFDEDFLGFLPSGENYEKSSSNTTGASNSKNVCKPTIQCYECMHKYEISELKIDQTTYLLIQSMEIRGSRWHCVECLNCTKSSKPISEGGVEKKIEKLSEQILSINNQMRQLTESHNKLEENTLKISNAAESITTVDKRSWAEIASVENPSVDVITNLTKQVLKDQKILCADREERENNVIIFNVEEKENHTDESFFNTMCTTALELNSPEVKVQRISDRMSNRHRPIKVKFVNNWEKRKFMIKLSKLKQHEEYSMVQVKHDMSIDDRIENKRLLKEAYDKNCTEKPTTFKYKVRGPPWAQRIVKVPLKKPEAAKEPVKTAVAEPANEPIALSSKN